MTVTPTLRTTAESQRLCLRFVLRHPIGFREYFGPKLERRRYWHRYTFSPAELSFERGDTTLEAGRGTGKSYSAFEPEVVRQALMAPGQETLITALRRLHVADRMERVIDFFTLIPLLSLYKREVQRNPYHIGLKTGQNVYGISVGDDPDAKMAQGKHVSLMVLEEAHQYPARAWQKIQGTKDPRGCRVLMIGVPDGRLDTPFRDASTRYSSFQGRRWRISRRTDPYFDQKTKAQLIEQYGGEKSEQFRQEVDAEWGAPAWSAWDIDALYRCQEPELATQLSEASGMTYRELSLTPRMAIADFVPPASSARRCLAMDVGYTQPSEVGVFECVRDRWRHIARLRITQRMEHSDQAAIVDALATLFRVEEIGIDASDGEGRAIAAELEAQLAWTGRVRRVLFQEQLVEGYTPTGEPVKDIVRQVATRRLRSLFANREIALDPRDEGLIAEFNKEIEYRTGQGMVQVKTPATVHITDMFRVFATLRVLETPPAPPEAVRGALVDLEVGVSPWASFDAQAVWAGEPDGR